MAWWNPKSWLSAPDPEAVPVQPVLNKPFIWVALRPDSPHMGIDFYSDAPVNPFKYAIQVGGLTSIEARSDLVGKVLDWGRFTKEELDGIESGNPPFFSHDALKAMYQ